MGRVNSDAPWRPAAPYGAKGDPVKPARWLTFSPPTFIQTGSQARRRWACGLYLSVPRWRNW